MPELDSSEDQVSKIRKYQLFCSYQRLLKKMLLIFFGSQKTGGREQIKYRRDKVVD